MELKGETASVQGALDGIPAVSGARLVFLKCASLFSAECEISFTRGLFAYRLRVSPSRVSGRMLRLGICMRCRMEMRLGLARDL